MLHQFSVFVLNYHGNRSAGKNVFKTITMYNVYFRRFIFYSSYALTIIFVTQFLSVQND